MLQANTAFKPYQPSQIRLDNYYEFIPQGTCRNSIALFYQFHPTPKSIIDPLIIVPDGCVDIIFVFDPAKPCVKAWGSVLKGTKLYIPPDFDWFGIRLLPGKASLLLNSPNQLVNEEILVTDIVQKQGPYLDKLANTPMFSDRVKLIMDEWILPVLQAEEDKHHIAQHIMKDIIKHKGNIRIEDVSEKSGYSIRYIDKIFRSHVGISPKQFSRIVRFQRILEKLFNPSQKITFDLVEEYGYFDQAHLIHEFKEFSLLTPSQFIQKNSRQ